MIANPVKQTVVGELVGYRPHRDAQRRVALALRTSWFDRVSSLLTAVMIFLGVLTAVLAFCWLLSGEREEIVHKNPPLTWGSPKLESLGNEFLQPQAAELVELQETDLRESLLAVTDAVSRVSGAVETGQADPTGQSESGGEARIAGDSAEAGDVPRHQRWQLDFEASSTDSYAKQLDHFGIELGLIGGSIAGVDYLSGLSTGPTVRRGDSGAEKRLYFMWSRENPLIWFDRQLFERAGLVVGQREILKFIPPELEKQLAAIELEYAMARGRSSHSVAKTVFFSEAAGGGYRLVVRQQRYRKQKD